MVDLLRIIILPWNQLTDVDHCFVTDTDLIIDDITYFQVSEQKNYTWYYTLSPRSHNLTATFGYTATRSRTSGQDVTNHLQGNPTLFDP